MENLSGVIRVHLLAVLFSSQSLSGLINGSLLSEIWQTISTLSASEGTNASHVAQTIDTYLTATQTEAEAGNQFDSALKLVVAAITLSSHNGEWLDKLATFRVDLDAWAQQVILKTHHGQNAQSSPGAKPIRSVPSAANDAACHVLPLLVSQVQEAPVVHAPQTAPEELPELPSIPSDDEVGSDFFPVPEWAATDALRSVLVAQTHLDPLNPIPAW